MKFEVFLFKNVYFVLILYCLFIGTNRFPSRSLGELFYEIKLKPNKAILIGSSFPSICFISFCLIFNLQLDLLSKMFLSAFCCNFCQILLALIWLGPINLFLFQTLESLIFHPVYTVQVLVSAGCKRFIGEVVASRRRPLLWYSPG